jgi:hypothetical protein
MYIRSVDAHSATAEVAVKEHAANIESTKAIRIFSVSTDASSAPLGCCQSNERSKSCGGVADFDQS